MQFQADLLGVAVRRPAVLETTALGAAYLAGLSSGFWSSIDELKPHRKADTIFEPKTDKKQMQKLQENWREAVDRSRHWNKESK
jgi:glycerol kinase